MPRKRETTRPSFCRLLLPSISKDTLGPPLPVVPGTKWTYSLSTQCRLMT
jgi:hypothetical protein